MGTTVSRQSVTYSIDDSPSVQTLIDDTYFNNIINCLLINYRELYSMNEVSANETNRKSGNGYNVAITQTSTTPSITNYTKLQSLLNSIQANNKITAADVSSVIDIATNLLQTVNTKSDWR